MNTGIKKFALAGAIALLAGAASADPLSWTEVEVGYNLADGGDDTTDAAEIRGSIGFAGIGHVSLGYLDGTSEDGPDEFDFDGYEIRAGVHPSVGDKSQLIAEAIYFDYSGDDGNGFDADEDGWGLGFGVRHAFNDQFEVRADIDYYNGTWDSNVFASEDFNNTSYTVSGRYYWTPSIYTGVGVTVGGSEAFSVASYGDDVIRVSLGWSFGGEASDMSDSF